MAFECVVILLLGGEKKVYEEKQKPRDDKRPIDLAGIMWKGKNTAWLYMTLPLCYLAIMPWE